MRGGDEARRAEDRALALEPSPEACLGALASARRRGDRARVASLLRFGLERFPTQPELLVLAARRGPPDPWAGPAGPPGGARAGRFPGPLQGQLRARTELPGVPQGPLRVDAAGGVWVFCAPGGLIRVDPSGQVAQEPGWGHEAEFSLVAGRPRCYQPAAGALGQAPGWPFAELRGGLVAWSGRGELEGDAGEIGWRRTLPWLSAAASPNRLLVLQGHEQSLAVSLYEPRGRELVRRTLGPLESSCDALWIGGEDPGWIVATPTKVWRLEPDLAPRWERECPLRTRPASDGQTLLCAQARGLCALWAHDGALRWEVLGLTLDHPPLLDGRGWTFALAEGSLIGLDGAGRRRLRLHLGREGPLGAPVLGEAGALYLTGQRTLLAVV